MIVFNPASRCKCGLGILAGIGMFVLLYKNRAQKSPLVVSVYLVIDRKAR